MAAVWAALPLVALPALPALSALRMAATDDTMHTLPWYFGLAVFVFWIAVAAGITLLCVRWRRARAERRRDGRRGVVRDDRPAVRDDRSLDSGKDLERW